MSATKRAVLPLAGGAALAFAVVAAPAALAAFPGENGKILFSRVLYRDPFVEDDDTEYSSLGVVQPNGRGRHRLPTCGKPLGRCEDSNGKFSPKGARIVFERAGRLFIAKADGTRRRTVPVPRDLYPEDPAWSPNGRRIVFSSDSLYVVRTNGEGLRRLTDGRDSQPAWSSSGEIAFVRRSRVEPKRALFAVAADGAGLRQVAVSVASPEWSPDGRSIVFDNGGRIYSIRADGDNRRRLGRGFDPAWSPNGRLIAFKRFGGIRVMSRRGGPQRVVANTKSVPRIRADEELFAPDWQPRPRERSFRWYLHSVTGSKTKLRKGTRRVSIFVTHGACDGGPRQPQVKRTKRAVTITVPRKPAADLPDGVGCIDIAYERRFKVALGGRLGNRALRDGGTRPPRFVARAGDQ